MAVAKSDFSELTQSHKQVCSVIYTFQKTKEGLTISRLRHLLGKHAHTYFTIWQHCAIYLQFGVLDYQWISKNSGNTILETNSENLVPRVITHKIFKQHIYHNNNLCTNVAYILFLNIVYGFRHICVPMSPACVRLSCVPLSCVP